MNRIKILLIDDRPGFAYKSENAFDHIPVMRDDTFGNFPELEKFFEVQWLQSPEDTKEFRDYCLEYESAYSSQELGLTSVVPDIILFDYALSGETAKQILPVALEIMPNVILGRKLKNPSYRENNNKIIKAPVIRDKIQDLPDAELKVLNQIGHDNMGCFSGGLIYSLFRNHPCSAIPTTRKFFTHIKGTHTDYFEWLIKDELYEATDLKGITVSWSKVIPYAVANLRKNIEIQIQNRKITPFLIDLANIASGSFRKNVEERNFSYNGIYGITVLPLDGLFLDVKKSERDDAIEVWGSNIFKKAFKESSFRPENKIIETAKEYAQTLWDAFQDKRFWDRLNFSKLHKIKENVKNDEKLSEQEENIYKEYTKLKNNNYFVIQVKKSKKGEYYVIKDSKELSGLIPGKKSTEFSNVDKQTLSWTALFVILKVFSARMHFIKKEKIKDFTLPTKKELITFLFPIASTPTILPVHNGDESEFNRFLKDTIFFDFDKLIDADENFFDEKTKFLLRCYAANIGLTDAKYFPEWIKSVSNE